MSRGGSKDPFYRRLDETTCIGPGVKKILTTRLGLLPCGCMGECRGHSDVEPRVGADAASRLPKAESAPDDCLDITDYGKVIIAARPAAPPVAEPAPQTFEEWWEVYRPQFDTYSAVGWKGVARAAWNAAKASPPVVAGGESAPVDGANLMPGVQIIRLGLGKVISNWGTSNGVPSVFIEPVLGAVGEVGQKVEDGREPQIKVDSVSAGGVIIEIHDEKGLKVLVEDLWTALHKFNEKHPEPLKCSDCVLIHGKSVCTMNCGPLIKDVRGKE